MTKTKAQEVYDEINRRVAAGVEKADAFRQLSEETSRPFDSLRGSYYSHKKKIEGGGQVSSRPRRRETTAANAVEQATATLRKAIESIDREITAAEERAAEATAEAKALKTSATDRKAEIEAKITALES